MLFQHQRSDTSISRLVGDFLAQLPGDEEEDAELSPIVRRLRGGPTCRESWCAELESVRAVNVLAGFPMHDCPALARRYLPPLPR